MSGGSPSLDSRGLPPGYPFKPDYEVTPREAREDLARGVMILVDVRTADEVRVSHVEGSLHIPLHELEARLAEIEPAMDAAPASRLAFLCHHGVRSMKAALFARDRGIDGAVSVAGGIDLWSIAADAAVPRYERDASGCRRT